MVTKETPKGMRDILPEDAILRREVLQTVETVYRKYGFVPLETPAMEYLATLRAKAGEEIDKQIFVLKNEELGIETNGKIVIRFASGQWPVASSQKTRATSYKPKATCILIELSKASDSDIANGISNKQQLLERQKSGDFWISFSKNGKYLRGDKNER